MIDPRTALELYKSELLKWTAKVNLIGPEAKEHLDEHIAEALAAADILNPQGEVLDFGSGGGLPAIPMAIVSPEARFHLVEADQKKWAFLKHIVRECGLSSQVYGDRLSRLLQRGREPRGVGTVVEGTPGGRRASRPLPGDAGSPGDRRIHL
jgi:16S rRNA (guanine(527)-N(7))-methyltransferase RsmG